MARCTSSFFHNKAALTSLFVLFCISLFVIFAPMLMPYPYDELDFGAISIPPEWETMHYFGTDASGRDLLVRVAIGGRISLLVGIAGALIAVLVGTLYGATSGYIGGKVDTFMMRFWKFLTPFLSCSLLSF